MNVKVPYLSKKILDLGSYTKPLLNFILENKVDPPLRHYLRSLEFIWKREYDKAKKEIELGLKLCKKNISVFYLLLSNKFVISLFLKENEFEFLYREIKRNLKKAPPTIRKILNQFLINSALILNKSSLSKSRFWSKEKELSKSTKLFLLIGKAREKIKENKIEEGINYYLKGYKIGKTIPHPSGIITCLNDISWYLKDIKPFKSLYFSEKGLYNLGFFYEDPKMYFYLLDTSFWIQRNFNYYRIFEISKLINNYDGDIYLKERYSTLFKESKKFLVDLEKSLYENSTKLKKYLKEKIKNISLASKLTNLPRYTIRSILNNKTKVIRGETLKKFINGFSFEIESDTPKEIFNEIIKLKLFNNFEKGLSFLEKKDLNYGKKLIIATYISLFNREKDFKTLSRRDVLKKLFYLYENNFDKLKEYLKTNSEFIYFVFNIINPNPFIKGRRDLILKFLNHLNVDELNRFIDFYLNLKEKEREILDIFLRNYIRFSRLSINLNVKFENYILLKEISESLKLNFDFLILSLYYFSKWDRVKVKRILIKLILKLKKEKIRLF